MRRSPSTAFRGRHRFLNAPALHKPTTLQGIVAIDAFFMAKSFKRRRAGLTRLPRKRGGDARFAESDFEPIPVLLAYDRFGATIDVVLTEDTPGCIEQALAGAVTLANQFVCDGRPAPCAFARRVQIPVYMVPAPVEPDFTSTSASYHARLQQWLRRFHGVAAKNLAHHLGWRRAPEASATPLDCQSWVSGALGKGRRPPLKR
jgi:hypothetical protein